ncbi:gamma-butyrobetaine dioxygenase-like [Glandiceps talaboti]
MITRNDMASVFLRMSAQCVGRLPRCLQTASQMTNVVNRRTTSQVGIHRLLCTDHSRILRYGISSLQNYRVSPDIQKKKETTITRTPQRGIHHDLKAVGHLHQAERCDDEKELRLRWNDGYTHEYPYVWLRDCCRCPLCFHSDAKARKVLIEDLDIDILPSSIELSEDGKSVTVVWPDNHRSIFESDFLRGIEFKDARPATKSKIWGSELTNNLPTFQFEDVMSNDNTLLEFLEGLRDIGLILVKNTPTEMGQVEKFGGRVSHIRVTNYGAGFSVRSKHEPSNLAYTGVKLGLHCDLPFYHYSPGIQVLHCIKQCDGEGGESLFADGFRAAMDIKEEDPEAYETLASIYIDYIDIGSDFYKFHLKNSWKVLTFDRFGELLAIHYNHGVRDYRMRTSKENVYKCYRAMKKFYSIMNREENLVKFKLESGDMVVFNNTRTLHGRTEFRVAQHGERHLEGIYLDWDCVHSRIRVLREELGMPILD